MNLNGKTKEEIIEDGWEFVGPCCVDSGLIHIGDPCYVLPRQGHIHGKSGLDYDSYMNNINTGADPIKFEKGHEGKGICLSNFGGDGTYNVYVQKSRDGGIVAAMIKFHYLDDQPEEDESLEERESDEEG